MDYYLCVCVYLCLYSASTYFQNVMLRHHEDVLTSADATSTCH